MTSSKSRPEHKPDLKSRPATPQTKQLQRLKRRELTLKDGRYLLLYESKTPDGDHA